jgi:hypothetical protein
MTNQNNLKQDTKNFIKYIQEAGFQYNSNQSNYLRYPDPREFDRIQTVTIEEGYKVTLYDSRGTMTIHTDQFGALKVILG